MAMTERRTSLYTLRQLKRARGQAGEPLPQVFSGLSFTTGQLTLLAAAPGTGKSILSLVIALKAKVPTLYFSADSDAHVQRSRAISVATGWDYETSEYRVRTDRLGEAEFLLDQYPMWMLCDSAPTIDTIKLWMRGYEAQFEESPKLVIVDNVRDVVVDSDEENRDDVMTFLHTLAHRSGAAVLATHHVNAQHTDGDHPIPRSGVKGQITDVPEQVLTAFTEQTEYGPDILKVSTVKNRGGKADASGKSFVELEFYGEYMLIQEPEAPGDLWTTKAA